MSMDLNSTEKDKRKKHKLLLLIILLLLLSMGGCFGYRYLHRYDSKSGIQREVEANLGLLPGMSDEEIQQRLNQQLEEGFFNVSMNGQPVFKNGKAKGNVNIENVPGNRYSFTVSVQVTSVDAEKYPEAAKYVGQTILTTGMMDPGSYLTEKKLDIDLPQGEYVCVATFTAYKTQDDEGNDVQEEFGATAVQIVLNVLS